MWSDPASAGDWVKGETSSKLHKQLLGNDRVGLPDPLLSGLTLPLSHGTRPRVRRIGTITSHAFFSKLARQFSRTESEC